MSISPKVQGPRKRGRRRAAPGTADEGAPRLPSTVSRPALIEEDSDARFRRLVYDLLTIATRMTTVREHLAGRMGITAPQYSLLMAVGQFQAERGVSVTAVAKLLHVSSAFVATETRKLAQGGLVVKRANPDDRRGVLLTLTRAGRALIERNSEEIRAVNDMFFGGLTRGAFNTLSATMADLVQSSARAVAHVDGAALAAWREAAE
jgi:DNA-binding MarR family transcriptional regulator